MASSKEEHRAWAEELGGILALWPGVRMQKMMGSYAIMTGTRMFGFPWQGGLVMKLDGGNRERLLQAGQAESMEMRGRPMGEWIRMPVRTPAEKRRALDTLKLAKRYVEATPPTTRRPKARKGKDRMK